MLVRCSYASLSQTPQLNRCIKALFASSADETSSDSSSYPVVTIPHIPVKRSSQGTAKSLSKNGSEDVNAVKRPKSSVGGRASSGTKAKRVFKRRKSSLSSIDEWTNEDWGPDRLAPPDEPKKRSRKLSYSRSVEGLLYSANDQVLQDISLPTAQKRIPRLAHGLERVLFNPGVHWLKDQRSHVYNFPHELEKIPSVFEFGFERLSGFIKSSRDEDLRKLAVQESRKYAGSTSSLSGMLCHIYFLLSPGSHLNLDNLSPSFQHSSRGFTPGQRMPASVIFNYRDGVYAIDSDARESIFERKNILTWMGTLLEKYLTTPLSEFQAYMRTPSAVSELDPGLSDGTDASPSDSPVNGEAEVFPSSTPLPCSRSQGEVNNVDGAVAPNELNNDSEPQATSIVDVEARPDADEELPEDSFIPVQDSCPEEHAPEKEAYRYSKSAKFVMRSQLDCQDNRLPGTGVFDIKTRACLPIRMDLLNFAENSGYLIRNQLGLMESFEREYYDLIRSAFLKYNFQARIGNMDGILVAYHNTAQIFGFQYIPLEQIDKNLFGGDKKVGDKVFCMCVNMLEILAEEITNCFPEQSVKCTFETMHKTLDIWVEPLTPQLDDLQPIIQLQVEAISYLGEKPVEGHTAIIEQSEPWTLRWRVRHLAQKEHKARQRLKEAYDRQFKAWAIPSGFSMENIDTFWKGLNFDGRPPEEGELPPNFFENFRTPDKAIRQLRALARKGRQHTEQLEAERAGQPKIVLGDS